MGLKKALIRLIAISAKPIFLHEMVKNYVFHCGKPHAIQLRKNEIQEMSMNFGFEYFTKPMISVISSKRLKTSKVPKITKDTDEILSSSTFLLTYSPGG